MKTPDTSLIGEFIHHGRSPETIRRGHVLYRIGDDADEIFLVTSGILRVRAGPDIRTTRFVKDGLVGEDALLNKAARRDEAISVYSEAAEVVRIPAEEFDQKLVENPEFARCFEAYLIHRLRRETANFFRGVAGEERRIKGGLCQLAEFGSKMANGDIVLPFLQADIADLSGVSPSNFSMKLAKMREAGEIAPRRANGHLVLKAKLLKDPRWNL